MPVPLGDGRQKLAPLHGPVDEQLSFLPARIHRLALQDDRHEEVTVFFEATGEAGAGCLCDPCLHPGEPVDAQEPVCVHPIV